MGCVVDISQPTPLHGGGASLYSHTLFWPRWKSPWHLLLRRLKGSQRRSGRGGKLALPGIEGQLFLVVQPLAWSLLYNGYYSYFAVRSVHRGTLTRPAVMLDCVPRSSSGSVSVNVKVLLMCCTLNVKLLYFRSLNV